MPHPRLPEKQRSNARRLRHEQTDAERVLWRELRSRSFTGFKFRRQHPLGSFILDFFCREAGLSIELDGAQHAEPEARIYDSERREYLKSAGILELRFWNNDVSSNLEGVLETILTALSKPPSPARLR